MGTVKDWLESQRFGDIALVLELDGMNLCLHSATHDTAGIATAWAATDWTTFHAGLRVPGGDVTDKIEAFKGTVTPQSLSFTVVDFDGAVALALLGTNAAAQRSLITADVDCDDTTLNVEDASSFVEGILHLGLEAIYSDTFGATTIGSSVRGYFSTFGTATGDRRGRPHRLDSATDYAPVVASSPTTHVNRMVSLWVTRWDGTAWATRAESTRLWSGRIKTIEDEVGVITIKALDLRELLNKTLLADQLTGTVASGLYMATDEPAITLDMSKTTSGTTTVYPTLEGTLAGAGTWLTAEEFASEVNDQIQTWAGGGVGAWPGTSTLVLEPTTDGRYRFLFTGSDTASTYTVTVGLAGLSWDMLGHIGPSPNWDPAWGLNGVRFDSAGRRVYTLPLNPYDIPSTLFHVASHGPRSVGALDVGSRFAVNGGAGAWHDQPDSVNDGFMLVGGGLYEVNEAAGVFTVVRRVSSSCLASSLTGADATNPADGASVKQVWFEAGADLGDTLYRLALSTGTHDYAYANDDTYPASMGCGVPYGALDRSSWVGLGRSSFSLVIEEPQTFRRILESALSVHNAHLVQRQGVLCVIRGVGATSSEEAVVTLDSSNTAAEHHGGELPAPTRTGSGYGVDGVINRLTLKYHRLIGSKEYARRYVVQQVASQTDCDMTRGMTIEADGFYGSIDGAANVLDTVVQTWIDEVASGAMAYCSLPYTVIRRSFAFPLATQLYPGATVLLTDASVIDPATGTRGVTSKAVWVQSVSFNWRTGVGEVELLLSPNAPTIRSWAPSAMVDHSAATGGYVAATKTLTLLAHQYSGSAEAADASHFKADDVVRVVQVSPAAAPLEWLDTVVSVTGNAVVLTTGLAAWDAALYYVVSLADDDEVTAPELEAHTFIGHAGHAWGPAAQPVAVGAMDYTALYRKISGAEDDATKPLSVHKLCDLARWVANFADHGSAQVLLNEMWATERTVGDGTYALIAGPILLPVTSTDRAWKLSVLGKDSDGGGVVKITISEDQPSGINDAALTWSGPTVSEEIDIDGTDDGWCDGAGIVPVRKWTASGQVCWVAVEAKSATGQTVSLRGLTLREVPL